MFFKFSKIFFNEKNSTLSWSSLLIIGCLILVNCLFETNALIISLTSVLGSIIASILVSVFYNEELSNIIKEHQKIGFNKYYSSFEDALSDIKSAIEIGSQVEIFVMFGSSFFNNNSDAIRKLLSKHDSCLKIYLYDQNNPFIDAYGALWGDDSEYNKEGIIKKINSTIKFLTSIKSSDGIMGTLEIFKIMDVPISYTYYKTENEIFYIPSKMHKQKITKPPAFRFIKTTDNIYKSVTNEIEAMKNDNSIIKFE